MADDNYLRWIRKDVLTMRAYAASERGFAVKLDAMESPYALPPALHKRWKEALSDCAVNRYPESEPSDLKKRLAKHIDMPDHCSLLLGNGSDELIQTIALALADKAHALVTPEPGFAIYRMAATVAGMRCDSVPLDSNFGLVKEKVLDSFERQSCALLCLAQPNNPTGNLWNKADLSEIIAAAPGYVLLDEAYEPFVSAASSLGSMDLLRQYPNLLVLRTFSKIGFAGLRFGFLVGRDEVIAELDKVRLPYNIGSLVQKGISLVLENYALIQGQVNQIRALRDQLFKAMRDVGKIEVFQTQTNFILFRTPPGTAAAVFNRLKEQGILIKRFSENSNQALEDCLRVTVSTAAENTLFLNALEKIIGDL